MDHKKKLGRPPAVGVARDKKLEVRMAGFELDALTKVAAREGLTVADYVRARLLARVEP